VYKGAYICVDEGLTLCNVEFGPKYSRLTKQCLGIVSLEKVCVCVCERDRERERRGGGGVAVMEELRRVLMEYASR